MMIKNFKELATNTEKKTTLHILEKGLSEAFPYLALKKILHKDKVVINNTELSLSKYNRIFVIAFGKAADSMASIINTQIHVSSGIIVIPDYANSVFDSKKFEILRAGHPVPNKQSVLAGKKILKFLAKTKRNDFIIFLISGGGSSLVSMPDGVTLTEKRMVTELLLKSGASVSEINCVRKHLSKIKGGRMTENLLCDGISLVMSDVIGDDLSSIASGSTYYDNTTFKDAKNILKKYDLTELVPKNVLKRINLGVAKKISETPKHPIIKNYIIATNKNCLNAMARNARSFGLKTKLVYPISGDVKQVAKKLVKAIPKQSKSCLIFGGETTVKVTGKGKGGRNQELVLYVLKEIQKTRQNITIASVGTDGKDGNTDAAGAITSNTEFMPKEIQNFLQNNNSYNFFKKYGGLIFTGPTHTNLMDIGIILRR